MCSSDLEAKALLRRYRDTAYTVDAEWRTLIDYWHGKLNNLNIHTPDDNLNTMVNTWNAFQCFTTFVWSRAASLIYCGERNGYGYRDTVQDIQGIIHLDPAMAKERIRFMLSAQVHHGAGLPLVKFTHNPGHEDTPEQARIQTRERKAEIMRFCALLLYADVITVSCQCHNQGSSLLQYMKARARGFFGFTLLSRPPEKSIIGPIFKQFKPFSFYNETFICFSFVLAVPHAGSG